MQSCLVVLIYPPIYAPMRRLFFFLPCPSFPTQLLLPAGSAVVAWAQGGHGYRPIDEGASLVLLFLLFSIFFNVYSLMVRDRRTRFVDAQGLSARLVWDCGRSRTKREKPTTKISYHGPLDRHISAPYEGPSESVGRGKADLPRDTGCSGRAGRQRRKRSSSGLGPHRVCLPPRICLTDNVECVLVWSVGTRVSFPTSTKRHDMT